MKIAILTCVNDRPKISPLIFLCYLRLKEVFDIQLIVGYSSESDGEMVEEWAAIDVGVHPVGPIENIPGQKWNTVLKYAIHSASNFDRFLIMGDDDSVSSEHVQRCISSGKDYCGSNKNGYINAVDGSAMVHQYAMKNKLIGAGRMISRYAITQSCFKQRIFVTLGFRAGMDKIEKESEILVPVNIAEYLVEYNQAKKIGDAQFCGLWPDGAVRSLDHLSELNLVMNGFVPHGIDAFNVDVVDVKSSVNIWPYSILERKCKPLTWMQATWFMSDAEINLIRNYHE